MENIAIRGKGDIIPVFVKTNDQGDECLIYKFLNDNSFSLLPHESTITEIEEDIYSTSISLPDEDCIIIIKFKMQPIVIFVGNPPKRFIYFGSEEGKEISYSHFKTDGDPIDNGDLIEIISGFYYHDVRDNADSIIEIDEIPYRIKMPHCEGVGSTSGTVLLQHDVWQLLAIPRENVNVKEYFVDRIASKYSLAPEDMVDICTAYFGSENKFRSYIPGITNPLTENNFPLVFSDDGNLEITGFWVKLKDLTGLVPDVNDISFEWSSL